MDSERFTTEAQPEVAESRNAPADQASGGSFWALLALLVGAAAILIALQVRRPKPSRGEYVGLPLPPLDAGGWFNTKAPLTASELRGKVVLVDFFASDCIPCIQQLPEVMVLNKRYRDSGLMIVGLSEQNGPRVQHLKSFIETRDGLDWPVAYDARFAYEVLNVRGTPFYLLYDRNGRSIWGGHTLDGVEEAIIAALADKGVRR